MKGDHEARVAKRHRAHEARVKKSQRDYDERMAQKQRAHDERVPPKHGPFIGKSVSVTKKVRTIPPPGTGNVHTLSPPYSKEGGQFGQIPKSSDRSKIPILVTLAEQLIQAIKRADMDAVAHLASQIYGESA